jgi:hypothetical protein
VHSIDKSSKKGGKRRKKDPLRQQRLHHLYSTTSYYTSNSDTKHDKVLEYQTRIRFWSLLEKRHALKLATLFTYVFGVRFENFSLIDFLSWLRFIVVLALLDLTH